MIEIKVRLSENSSEEERSRLHIEDGAVRDFLGTGYIDCIYDAEVVHHFPPRAISPDQIQFFIELGDIIESGAAITMAIKAIKTFLKRTKGYRVDVTMRGERNGKNIEVTASEVDLSDISKVLDDLEKEVFHDKKEERLT